MVQPQAARVVLTRREAKRIALRNIIAAIEGDMLAGAEYWRTCPETRLAMREEDVERVAAAAKEILVVLDRRARRLRSCFSAAR